MKKILFVLIMLLAVGMLSAATSVTLGNSSEGTASIKVVLPLKSGEGFEYVTVGFTKDSVTEKTSGEFDAVTPFASDEVELTPDGDNTASITSGLYAYWQIRTEDTVTVTLSKEKALTGADLSNEINWKITAKGSTQNMNEYTSTSAITLVNAWTNETDTINQGSALITIETEDYSGKPTDDYSANLVLNVTADGE